MSSGIKLKVLPKFPAQVIGEVGIDVSTANGNFYFNLDVSQFPLLGSLGSNPNLKVLLWDSLANVYYLVPTSVPVMAESKISELEQRIADLEQRLK
jgi:hypothetical protein